MVTQRMIAFRRRIYQALPSWVVNNDFELLGSLMCLTAGVPLLLGQIEPRSVNDVLPYPLVFFWAFILTGGSVLVLGSIFLDYLNRHKVTASWLRFEALGLSCIGYACYVYASCITVTSFQTGGVVVALLLAFGFVCHIRDMKIHDYLDGYGPRNARRDY